MDSKPLYYRFLQRNYPELISRHEQLFGMNYYQPRQYQDSLKKKILQLCERYGIRNGILPS